LIKRMGKQSRRKNRPGGGSSAKNAGAEQVQHFPDHTKNLPDINFDYHHCSLCGKELELTSDWKEVVSTFMPCCGAAACNRCSHKWNKSKDQSLDANQTKFDMLVDAATKREIPDIPGLLAIINARADAQTCPDCKGSLHRHNKELVARMTRLAAGGHALGQYTLAIAHRRGKFGLIPNGQTALGWYQKAADSGISSAATAMGNMYQLGGGIPQNFSKAKALYLRALEISSQDAEAMFGLGYLYQNGSEVERDEEAALSWFRCSAQQEEYPDGIVKYAVALADRGLEKEALDWYLKAAKLDRRFPRNYRDTIAEAQYPVGTLLLDFHRDEGRPVGRDHASCSFLAQPSQGEWRPYGTKNVAFPRTRIRNRVRLEGLYSEQCIPRV